MKGSMAPFLKLGAQPLELRARVAHDKFRPPPPAKKVEEILPLAYIENFRFERAKLQQAALGAPPAAINGAAQLQPLYHAPRGTQVGRALHTTPGTQPIQTKLGTTRGRGKKETYRR